jgi:hypothetical protein
LGVCFDPNGNPPDAATPVTCDQVGGECKSSPVDVTFAANCEQDYQLVTSSAHCPAVNQSCCVHAQLACSNIGGTCVAPNGCVTADKTIADPIKYPCGAGQVCCVPLLAPVCTVGMDQTCNDNPALSSIHGTCALDANLTPYCTCKPGFAKNPTTGRCL